MSEPDYARPALAGSSPANTARAAPAARAATTPREALQRGENWWADCPRCKCAGRLDLNRLVANGRGDVGADAMRCSTCKHPDISVRITSPLANGCAG